MKVEILEKKLMSDGFTASEGDLLTVPDSVGVAWCSRGWAKDTVGTVPTGERNINPVEINPKKLQHNNEVTEAK